MFSDIQPEPELSPGLLDLSRDDSEYHWTIMGSTDYKYHSQVDIIDLYCGLGGLGIGFEYTKSFRVVAGIDFAKYAVDPFANYHGFTKPAFIASLLI